MAMAPNRAKVRGHRPKAHSEIGLATVIRETARLWRKHALGYDQTKYVFQKARSPAPGPRRRLVALAAGRECLPPMRGGQPWPGGLS